MPNNYPDNWKEPLKNNKLKINKNILEEQEVLIDEEKDNYLNRVGFEIDKVKNKIPNLWLPNPTQINSKILINFMKLLSQSKTKFVSQRELKEMCFSIKDFNGNFNQMSYLGEKNHGKVFEVDGDNVKLWEPVEKFIIDEWNKNAELHQ
jgi:hypothetical protein